MNWLNGFLEVVINLISIPITLFAWVSLSIWRFVNYYAEVEDLKSRHVVISGCDSGVGYLTALDLATKKNLVVFAGCLTDKGIEELKSFSSHPNLKPFKLDICSESSVNAAARFVSEQLPEGVGIHALINNAGVSGQGGPASWLTTDDFKACLDVNLYGHIRMTQAFLSLVKQAQGRIIFMCSMVGHVPLANRSPYTVSKYGLVAYADAIRMELCRDMNIITISPGFFRSAMSNTLSLYSSLEKRWKALPQAKRDEHEEDHLEKKRMAIDKFLEICVGNNRIDDVVDCYVHAVTAKYPKQNYWVGRDSKFYARILAHLPEDVQVWNSLALRTRVGDPW